MLNKELLLGYTKGQRKVKLTIGHNRKYSRYGYYSGSMGSVDVLPYWINSRYVIHELFADVNETIFKLTYDDEGVEVTVYVEGYPTAMSSGTLKEGDIYSMRDNEGFIRHLTFDLPPRRVLGSKYTPTDLGRGYYVEEDPWEAQNAEQGTSDGGRWQTTHYI